jgi:mono/diheme cytochrome c family protein
MLQSHLVRRVAGLTLTTCLVVSLSGCGDRLPDRPQETIMWAEQGWTDADRAFYHYTSQGTVIAPAPWFMALERPFSKAPIADPVFLGQLGFLPMEKSAANPLGLPVGFAVHNDQGPPADKAMGPTIGFTCAACHTGQLSYKGRALRVDGGQAGADVTGFSGAFGLSLIETYYNPWKYKRFAKKVLADRYKDKTAYAALRANFAVAAHDAIWEAWNGFIKKLYPTKEGFTRLDALGRIGNTVFGSDLHEANNLRVANAPVNFPYLWDIWKFDWVQYNGSVHQPMARNVGEALGVRARTNFVDAEGRPIAKPEQWDTSIPVDNLKAIEERLWSLKAPRWPSDLFGTYDDALAREGKALFATHCSGCHAPRPIKEGENQQAQWAVAMVPLSKIGTDPLAAANFAQEKLDGSKLTGLAAPIDPAQGLHLATDGTKDRAYDLLGLSLEQRAAYNGFGRQNLVRAPCGYKARPLDGVWATPPYLHNGSVPTIYALLSPLAERPKTFWLGNFEYDPQKLGYVETAFDGGFLFDVSKPGNSNAGHLFTNAGGPGVIGPELSDGERKAIIDYLKAMQEMPPTQLEPVPASWGDEYPCMSGADWTRAHAK